MSCHVPLNYAATLSGMTTSADTRQIAAEIIDTSVSDFWRKFQYAYVLYTLTGRSLPSVYDGLLPVQRRVLVQMSADKILPGTKPRKSAKVCGAVSANYHPHADSSIYNSAALMAATFQRVCLIDGQGSFACAPGDTPAADRYSEMRLSREGWALIEELSDDSVPVVPTFDGELTEPPILPARYPALLMRGSKGVSGGAWASNIPSHNPREILALCRAMLNGPVTDEEMLALVPGPDWGFGGTVVGSEAGIISYMTTGRGQLTVRGDSHIEKATKGRGERLVVTSLPPDVQWGTFLESVRDFISSGKIDTIRDIENLSGRNHPLRLVFTPKKGKTAEDVRENLLSAKLLEKNFSPSLVALDAEGEPRWWSVKETITAWLELRDSVIIRRSESRLRSAAARKHTLDGLLVIQADIDAAVAIIRAAKNADEARTALTEHFGIDAEQASNVLSMRLGRLTSQDTLELEAEAGKLAKEIENLNGLIKSPARRKTLIGKELTEVEKMFADGSYDRRTRIEHETAPALSLHQRRAAEGDGNGAGVSPLWRLTEHGTFGSDGAEFVPGSIWAVFSDGRVKRTEGKGLPNPGREVPVAPDISALLTCGVESPDRDLLLITRRGKALRLDLSAVNPQGVAGNGVSGVKLGEVTEEDPTPDAVIGAFAVTDDSAILLASEAGHKVLAARDVPRKGRGSQGVGVYSFTKADRALYLAEVSDTGFLLDGKKATATKRPASPSRTPLGSWERA